MTTFGLPTSESGLRRDGQSPPRRREAIHLPFEPIEISRRLDFHCFHSRR
jgi:hypothetical protein